MNCRSIYLEHPQWIADLSFFCMHGPLSVCDLWASLPSGPGRELQDAYCRRGLKIWRFDRIYFYPELWGDAPIWQNVFQMGWNHITSDIWYCRWIRNPKANDLGWWSNPENSGINYQPQLVVWDFSTINSRKSSFHSGWSSRLSQIT